MPSISWWNSGWVWLPENLIVGLADGFALPSTAYDFTAMNGKILCGTVSDLLVGLTESTTNLSLTTGSGGTHSTGDGWVPAAEYSFKDTAPGTCPAGCANHSWNGISYGGHTHSLTGSYTPKRNGMRLIRVNRYSPPTPGMIMFGDSAVPHDLISTFNGNGGFLAAGTELSVTAEIKNFLIGSGSLASHDHHTSYNVNALYGPASGWNTLVSAGGAAHSDHSISPLSVSPALKAATVRAYKLISGLHINRLIGMWDRVGDIPPNWSLVAEFDGRHLKFAADGSGSLSGNDTLTISGNTGGSTHAHNPSSPGATLLVGYAYHTSLQHSHSVAATPTYKPNRYMVKFIRYEG